MNKPANLSVINDVLWPLTQRIILDECAADIMRVEPRGVKFEADYTLAADALVEGGYLTESGRLYKMTRKGWDVLGATIFKT